MIGILNILIYICFVYFRQIFSGSGSRIKPEIANVVIIEEIKKDFIRYIDVKYVII